MGSSCQIINRSTVVSPSELLTMVTAVQHQLNDEVAKAWMQEPTFLKIVEPAAADPNEWQIIFLDNATVAGALGYHDFTAGGMPIGYVFAKTTKDAGLSVSVTFSHEAGEMFLDPYINTTIQMADNPHALFYGMELCDPVEDDSLGYNKAGVRVSDFVYPAYFEPGSLGPWDFCGHLKAPATLTPGGYQGTWDPKNGWQQVLANHLFPGARATLSMASVTHSRRGRRSKARSFWQRSRV